MARVKYGLVWRLYPGQPGVAGDPAGGLARVVTDDDSHIIKPGIQQAVYLLLDLVHGQLQHRCLALLPRCVS